ncbi:WhiB family transcriptional regulator [Streptomyces sp. NPDC051211]|uniref:WhiB family transcriptional regulator n=1 Tax=Streptomyces sp. NPDC051211 TaxID=3154643 RepID=UPI00345101EF
MSDVSRLPGAFEHHWSWQLHAACRTLGSGMFFHPTGERGPEREDREEAAKRVCADCPVRRECLTYALRAREPYGVWGGLSARERRAVLTA